MITLVKALLIYILLINVITFIVYGIDKWKAKSNRWRISESTLIWMAVIGGAVGAQLGMSVWHHKTMHKKFKYGIPAILITHVLIAGFAIYQVYVNN